MMEQRPAPSVRLGEWISEGWEMFTKQWQSWVLVMLAMFAVYLVVILPGALLPAIVDAGRSAEEGPSGAGLLISLLSNILTWLVAAFLMAGGYRTAFKQLRGEPISVGDAFSASDVFLPVLGAQFLISLMVGIGIILCIIPGLVVNGLFYFTLPLIVARRLGIFEAMQRSLALTKQNILMFTILPIVIWFLGGIGVLACGVGLLATFPLYFTITSVAFRDLFGLEGTPRASAAPQIPAYTPQAYNQQSWANQPPQSYAPPQPPAPAQPFAPPRPFAPPQPFAPPAVPQAPAPPSESQGQTKVCPHCQAVLQRAANFCNFCGKPLNQ